MEEWKVLAIMAAIVYAGADSSTESAGYTPTQAVVLREAKKLVDHPTGS